MSSRRDLCSCRNKSHMQVQRSFQDDKTENHKRQFKSFKYDVSSHGLFKCKEGKQRYTQKVHDYGTGFFRAFFNLLSDLP